MLPIQYATNRFESRRAAIMNMPMDSESLKILEQLPDMVAISAPSGDPREYCYRDMEFTGPVSISWREAAILALIAKNLKAKRVLEVGCGVGWATAHIAPYATNIVCVDPFNQTATGFNGGFNAEMADKFIRNMQSLGFNAGVVKPKLKPVVEVVVEVEDKKSAKTEVEEEATPARQSIQLIVGPTPEALSQVPAKPPFDMAYLDGNTSHRHPTQDVQAIVPLLAAHGLLVLQHMWVDEVQKAATVLTKDGWHLEKLDTVGRMGVLWKGKKDEAPKWWATLLDDLPAA